MCKQEFADALASAVHSRFMSLGKPPREGQYVMLSAVVKIDDDNTDGSGGLTVVALGTGSKCIGENQYSNNGTRLHDR